MKTLCPALALLFIGLLCGCASSAADDRVRAAILEPESLVLLRGSGSKAGWSDLVASCVEADAVLIGECHGHDVGQAFQTLLFQEILSGSPNATAALEFFERDEQAALDDYLRGLTDEAEFRRATHRTDSNFTSGHRAMVEACKSAGRPVIAANSPRRYVRIARIDGFERLGALTPEQQRLFMVPRSIPEGRYQDEFFKVMGAEDLLPLSGNLPEDSKAGAANAERRQTIEGMFRSQSLWDWTMADSVASEMARGGRPVVLVVGRFHIDHDGGLVQALRAMRPGTRIVTISSVNAWSEELREEDRAIADFVVYIGSE